MTEAAGSARAQMERRIVQRSIEDDAFRQRLIENPKGAVEQELGTQLPEEVRVVTVEESADTMTWCLQAPPWQALRAENFQIES